MHDGAMKHRKAARQMAALGTFETLRFGLAMSVGGTRPEVAGEATNRRE